jgi:hypothetical protein
MIKNKILLFGFMLALTACGVKGADNSTPSNPYNNGGTPAPTTGTPTPTPSSSPSPTPSSGGGTPTPAPSVTPSPTPANSIATTISAQTSANGIVGFGFDDPLKAKFFNSSNTQVAPPSPLDILAYTNSNCSTLATGSLTFSQSIVSNELILNNLMYSKAEDVYIGISSHTNSNVLKACSNLINVMSGAATNFSVVSGDSQTATVGTNLPSPIKFLISDASNHPVANANIHIDGQYSLASDVSGFAYLTYNVGQQAGNLSKTSSLTFNGSDLDQITVSMTAVPSAAQTITLGSVQPTTVKVASQGGVTDPYYLMALDSYGNPVYPSQWTFSFGSYADPQCTVPGQAIVNEQDYINNAINNNDPSTWLTLAIFSFNDPGSVYLKFNLLSNSGRTLSSVCSNVLNVTPN